MTQREQGLQKTGIASIDSFFRYDENSDKFERYPFTPEIPQVLEMFTSEYTRTLMDRKAVAVMKLCENRPHGFFYEEVEGLTQLLAFMREDLFAGSKEMVTAIQRLLAVDSPDKNNMFNKNLSSDELRYMGLVPGFLDALEPLLKYTDILPPSEEMEGLKETVTEYLKRFASRQIPEILSKQQSFENAKSELADISPMQALLQQGTKHLRALAQSKVLKALIELLTQYDRNASIIYPLLELFSCMMMYSGLAQELCDKGVLHLVLEVLLLCEDFRSSLVKTAFGIIWSALDSVGVETLKVFSTEHYVHQLRRLFVRVIREGYKLEDKCLRNELLILINYLLSLPESLPYFLTPREVEPNEPEECFLEVLFHFATVDEVKFSEGKAKSADRKVQFGVNSQDLELKKLFWSGLLTSIESGVDQAIEIAQKRNFIKYLLVYIDSANTSYAVTRWSSPQLRELQQHALSVLANVVLHMKDDFESKKGVFCLTKFLSNNTDIERREKCLKAFSNASLFDEEYKIKISEEGVMDYLIQFLQSDDNPLEIKELCFTIVANLCQGCKKNKKLFREKNGIDIVISFLKDNNIATSNRYVLLALSLLNCLWNAILGSRRSEERFLNAQGLFDLLEFIEACDYSHRKLALSCLSFLTENSKAVQQFLEWNSEKTMCNATKLLIRIYVEEDERYGVKYEKGMVTNPIKPLHPNETKRRTAEPTHLKDLTGAGPQTYLVNRIREEVEEYDLRMSVFSILYRVGFNKNSLTSQEQQKMEVIQMYPHFRMGEIWWDIRQQLEKEGHEPTPEDSHWMETAIEEFEEQMSNCMNTQQLIMKEFHRDQEADLTGFYQVIKYNKQSK